MSGENLTNSQDLVAPQPAPQTAPQPVLQSATYSSSHPAQVGARELLRLTDRGLYCAAGDFYVDPWTEVERAVITHAHSDHARSGHGKYLCAAPGEPVLRHRVGPDSVIETLPYGQTLRVGEAVVSFHPAGHILGSAQVRVEHGGEVWVVSGDYKVEPDATCTPLEPVRCHTFITEATFGLPIFRWRPQSEIFAEINEWWADNRAEKKTSVVFVYALGKAQRALAGLDTSIGPLLGHGAVIAMTEVYRRAGVSLPALVYANDETAKATKGTALVLAPPSAMGSTWLRKFGDVETAFLSGWMAIRGNRRRRGVARGFVLSDHADWPGLLSTIDATGAERVLVTHGSSASLSTWLQEQGTRAEVLSTRFGEEETDAHAVQ